MPKQAKKTSSSKRTTKGPYKPDQVSAHVSLTHQKLVGRVIMAWAKLEATLHDMVWNFVGVSSDDGRILTGRQDATHLIKMIRALSKRHLDKAISEYLGKLLTGIETTYADRNFIAHGNWGSLVPGNIPIAGSLRAKSDPGEYASEEFPTERMELILRRIEAGKRALIGVSDGLPTLLGRQPAQPSKS